MDLNENYLQANVYLYMYVYRIWVWISGTVGVRIQDLLSVIRFK